MSRKATLILMLVAVLILAACAQAPAGQEAAPAEEEAPAEEAAPAEEEAPAEEAASRQPTTVRIQVSFGPVEAQEKMREYAAQFNEENSDINVVVEYVPWEQLRQSLLTNAMAGSLPDIIQASSTQSSLEMSALGAWADLSSYLTPEWVDQQQFLDGSFEEIDTFGVPWLRVTEGIIFYDKQKLEEAGVEPPPVDEAWTWDEFIEAAQALTIDEDGDGTPDQWGFGDRARLGFILEKAAMPYFYSVGQDVIYEKDGEWRSAFELPEVQEAFRFYVDLYREYQVKDPGTLAWGFAEASRAWQEDTVAMINIGEWFRDAMEGEFEEDWDVMLFPTMEGHEPAVFQQLVYWHITQQSQNKDAAWEFINFLMAPERVAELGHLDTDSPPNTVPALEQPYWAENAFVNERIATWAPYATFINPHEQYQEIWETTVGPIMHEAVLGTISVDEAITTIDDEINSLLGVQ